MAGFKDIDWNALKEKISEIELDDINNIAWDNMGGWPLPGKVFFAVLVFVALLIAGNIFLITDMRTSLASEVAKEEQLKADFERKAFRGANLDAYKEQMVEMEQSFGSLLKQLPRETEVPGLIDDISSAALGSGLSLNGIDPQAIVSTEFYNELPIKIEVEGGYHEMGSFVSAVASLPRIVTLHDFTIKEGSGNGRLTMQILAKTYQYNSDEEGR